MSTPSKNPGSIDTQSGNTGSTIPAHLPNGFHIGPNLLGDAVTTGMGQLILAVTQTVQQDLMLIRAVPDNILQEQFTARLNSLQSTGHLTSEEAATLQSIFEGQDAAAMPPPFITPDGAPSLCGFIGSAMRSAPKPTTDALSAGGVATVGLSAVGGAAIGGALADGPGAVAGAVAGAVIAAASAQ